ncbi:MAG: M48 family metalloprotease [Candidatus Sumerlaeia bacterium]|nr:M48 family metalloprotease [Candidatus Sumerlaeia bacterium]
MLAGLGRTRRIYLADTLLRQFTPDEIYTVAAHEFAHHFYHHIWKGIALQTGIIFIAMASLKFFVSTIIPDFALQELANLPLITLLIGATFMVCMLPLHSILRQWELQADSFAVRITRLRNAFISALHRLAHLNLANPEPSSLIETLFYTHPPIKKRITALK